jgi:hypothetical protein
MIRKVIQQSWRRKGVTVRHVRMAASTRPVAPWEGVRVKIEDLPAFRARWGLLVVGGDPDLEGQLWRPKVWVVEG